MQKNMMNLAFLKDIYPSNNEMEEIKKHFLATHSNEILQLGGLNK